MSHPANLASGATVTASSDYGGFWSKDHVVDDLLSGAGGYTWLTTPSGTTTGWIKVDLGSIQTITHVNIVNVSSYGTNAYSIDVSEDDSSWTTGVASGNLPNDTSYNEISIGTRSARYVRVNCNSSYSASWVGLSEVQVFNLTGWTERLVSATVTGSGGTVANLDDGTLAAYWFHSASAAWTWVSADLGSLRFVSGGHFIFYTAAGTYAQYMHMYTSDDGADGSWVWREKVDLGADTAGNHFVNAEFSRAYVTRYVRFVFEQTAANSMLVAEARLYTETPSVPPTPTGLGGGYDSTSGGVWLEWTLNSNSDNPTADQVVEVSRDTGYGFGSIGTTGLGDTSFWDSSGAAGYRYKVRATNQYTDLDSSYTSPITVAAPSGSGAELGPFETGAWR